MNNFAEFFDAETQTFVENNGCIHKANMFDSLMKGDREALSVAVEKYIQALKMLFSEDRIKNIQMHKHHMVYCWIQLCSLADCGGLPEECCSQIVHQYFHRIDEASSIADIDELCRELMYEYFSMYEKSQRQHNYSLQIQSCCDFIRANIREKLSIQLIAEKFHFSESYLSHKFKEETGNTVNQFILNEKIHEAKLMLHCALSIAAIAQELQFSSQSHFTATFKKYTGKTPGQFRKQIRKKVRSIEISDG